ncbi:hypothetical protein HQQ81_16125 [Microbacteriaceae bacterium VKM Ac-2854]|nr:hypothetical protein [Microbacteriaceae bacterium VKM Ac-2854]
MTVHRPAIADERIARCTNHDARRAPSAEVAILWRGSRGDFGTTQAAAQVCRAMTPILRALGFRDVQLLRILPLLTHIGGIVYRADERIERRQRDAPGSEVVDVWGPEILALLGSLGIRGARVRRAVAPLRELAELETALVSGRARSAAELDRMIELRPFDLVLHAAVAAEIAGSAAAEDLQLPLRELFVLRDVVDDLGSLAEDEAGGTFNCYLVAERLWGTDTARDHLDARVRIANGRVSDWVSHASDSSMLAFAVAVAEPTDDTAADAAYAGAQASPEETRGELLRHFARGAERGFAEQWRSPQHRGREIPRGVQG